MVEGVYVPNFRSVSVFVSPGGVTHIQACGHLLLKVTLKKMICCWGVCLSNFRSLLFFVWSGGRAQTNRFFTNWRTDIQANMRILFGCTPLILPLRRLQICSETTVICYLVKNNAQCFMLFYISIFLLFIDENTIIVQSRRKWTRFL